VVCAGLAVAGRSHFDGLAVGAVWVRVLGLAVLVASTVFTLWARFSLGTMWSVAPRSTVITSSALTGRTR
jgi:hypothetical protein